MVNKACDYATHEQRTLGSDVLVLGLEVDAGPGKHLWRAKLCSKRHKLFMQWFSFEELNRLKHQSREWKALFETLDLACDVLSFHDYKKAG